jgi:membrane protein
VSRDPGHVLKDALRIFSARGARFLGAAVAFYALLSAAPLFVVVLHLVSAAFGRERAESALWGGLSQWLSPDGLQTVRSLTERLERSEGSAGVLGALLVVYGSTRLFRALHRAINQLWGINLESVEAARPRPLRYGLRYGRALFLTLFVALIVTALIIVKTAFAFVATMGARPAPAILWGLDAGVSVVLAFVLFVALFRLLPETRISLREAATSACVSTPLFALGSAVVTIYVGHKHTSDLYAGAGAVVVAILWVYYSAQVFFLGACVGAVIHGQGTKEEDKPNA